MPLETADSKVKEICEMLRKQTLEPAQNQAKKIVADAEKEAEEIIHKAKEEILFMKEKSKLELEKELRVHEGSIQLAIRQGISTLRQGIEKVFARNLDNEIEAAMGKEDAVANAISVLLTLIEKEGLGANLSLLLPKHVDLSAICNRLKQDFAEKVKKSAILLDEIKGGAEIKLKDKKMSIELTDQALKELLASYVIPELREKIFE
jgi:V/A-type H+-transporting ATPase subunit E